MAAVANLVLPPIHRGKVSRHRLTREETSPPNPNDATFMKNREAPAPFRSLKFARATSINRVFVSTIVRRESLRLVTPSDRRKSEPVPLGSKPIEAPQLIGNPASSK